MQLETLDREGDAYAVAFQLCDILSAALSPRAVRISYVSSDVTGIAIEGDDGEDWTLSVQRP